MVYYVYHVIKSIETLNSKDVRNYEDTETET